jgi:DNA repair protein RecN (Recombination protein N)
MLVELHIENFAIIDRLDVSFTSGLITFTGETGAGKSIIIDAVETLLGGRVESNQIRSGSERAHIEGIFKISPIDQSEVLEILKREEFTGDDEQYLTLGREIRANGRSIGRINGRSVGITLLREIGEYLIDVHGQSEHLSLLHVNQHLGLLDNYLLTLEGPPAHEQMTAYRQIYHDLQSVRRELDALHQAEREAARRSDIFSYQIKEIESAHLHPGEEEELREERNRLANAEGLASTAQEALQALDEGTSESPAATDLFGQTLHAVHGLVRLDSSQAAIAELAEALNDNLSDLVANLREYLERIEFNPRRLDQVEERLGLIQTLKRKYGDDIQAVLKFANLAKEQLDAITHAAERIETLNEDLGQLLNQLGRQGQELSEKRRAVAKLLEEAIETELADLHMSGARFKVDFQQKADPDGAPLPDGRHVAYFPSGLEKVEFLIAPNPGEGLKPLAKIASGGETSRLMLGLKNVLAKADHIPTLIFDEIDQGIGGRVGTVVGEKLSSLARQHQVLCITHLPQLAVFGEQHFHVEKQVQAGRTTTQINQLEGEARLEELAQMLGGKSEGTLQSARELVQYVEERTNQ